MLIRSLASIFIVISSVILLTGQTPDVKKDTADKLSKPVTGTRVEKLRDIPFPTGVDTQFLIKELARDMDMNVLFDTESFRAPRKTSIELRNVTAAAAINAILTQEGLIAEEVGPRTILISSRFRGTSIPHLNLGVTALTRQLAQYFGVEMGILINNVPPDSAAAKAGLKAGDVIVELDGTVVQGPVGLARAVNDKTSADVTLKVMRDRKALTVTVPIQKVLQ
jgi:membrane-associated protease RseP (regulator of RpoE activity)